MKRSFLLPLMLVALLLPPLSLLLTGADDALKTPVDSSPLHSHDASTSPAAHGYDHYPAADAEIVVPPPPQFEHLVATVIFSGARFGELAPCECRSLQYGGVDREATLLREFKREGAPQIRIDAGGFSAPLFTAHEHLKAEYVLRALARLDYRLVNAGWSDLALGLPMLREQSQAQGIELLSANIIDTETSKPAFTTFKTIDLPGDPPARLLLVPITDVYPKDEFNTEEFYTENIRGKVKFLDPAETARQIIQTQRREGDIVVVLLFSDPSRSPIIMENMPPVDLVMNGFHYLGQPRESHIGPNRMVTAGYRGRFFQEMAITREAAGKAARMAALTTVPVPSGYAREANLTQLLDEYTSETIQRYRGKNPAYLAEYKPPEAYQPSNRYVGVRMCANCHEQEHTSWQATQHAHALETLREKKRHYDPDCLKCHTVGYMQGGFYNLEKTPHLGDVQCEVCHGPGYLHTDERQRMLLQLALSRKTNQPGVQTYKHRMRTAFDESFCVQCHDVDNDSHFDFMQDIKSISHQKTAQEDPAQDRP
ncbi:hypothetical protein JXA32_03080 [Candidatus Sumerlaeota bacterium]|nr:hypothetical protein [Candidatus Sumerlaeota bacterium]